MSNTLRANMNAGYDPCDNFDQYACGNFRVDHKMLVDKCFYSSNNIIAAEVKRVLVEELAKPGPSNESVPLSIGIREPRIVLISL